MSQSILQNLSLETRDLFRYVTQIAQKKHKSDESINFLTKCSENHILPNFTKLNAKTIKQAKLSKDKIIQLRKEKVTNEIQIQRERFEINSIKFDAAYKKLQTMIYSKRILGSILNTINNNITHMEKLNDNRRNKILHQLINDKNFAVATINIFNDTQLTLPQNICEILKFGFDHAIGSTPKPVTMLTNFDTFFKHWETYAKTQELDPLKIHEFRAHLYCHFSDLSKCFTDTRKTKELTIFLKNNPNIIICPVDKSKDLHIMYLDEYKNKLLTFFSDENKFEKLSKNPLEKNLENLRKLISTMKPFLNKSTIRKIGALEKNKVGYGIIKRHKQNMPVRPIISSIGSLTCGIEEYLLKVISPLAAECQYAVESTKAFKAHFLKSNTKFDENLHEVLSFDAIQLYTSVNTHLVIKYIVDKIFKNRSKYFKEGYNIVDDQKILIPYPTKKIFKQFLEDTLLKYNCFSTLNGYYKQKNGLSMGSKLSPILSNIYCNLMEQEIIKKHEKNGNIESYCRFVDDIYLVVRKGTKNDILNDMNSFDPLFLKLTIQEIENNSLVFLDTSIFIDNNGKLQLKMYRKPNNSDVKINYKCAIMPKKYKLSSLSGDIFRCFYTTTTPEELEIALNNMSNLYINNNYPKNLIKNKIMEIRNRNFTSNANKKEREKEIMENPEKHYNLCLSFSAQRCEKISHKIINLVKKFTPEYKLNICWKSEKLSKFYSPRLKLSIPEFEKTGSVYEFVCKCKINYIGETQRRLTTRISEHNQRSNTGAISDHIYSCQTYIDLLKETHGDKPSPTNKIKFITDCFKPIGTNLHSYNFRKDYEAIAISLFKPP